MKWEAGMNYDLYDEDDFYLKHDEKGAPRSRSRRSKNQIAKQRRRNRKMKKKQYDANSRKKQQEEQIRRLIHYKMYLWKTKKDCALCKSPIRRKKHLTLDHVVPKFHGGTDDIHNLQITHSWCNHIKGMELPNQDIDPYRWVILKAWKYYQDTKHAKITLGGINSFFTWYFGGNHLVSKSFNHFVKITRKVYSYFLRLHPRKVTKRKTT